jgi:hypothetical protein
MAMLIEDLKQTFENLKKWKRKLNPNKCVFGVPSGQLLGFLVSHRGIKASTKQIQAITEMGPPLWQNLLNYMVHMHLSFSQRPLTAMHVF